MCVCECVRLALGRVGDDITSEEATSPQTPKSVRDSCGCCSLHTIAVLCSCKDDVCVCTHVRFPGMCVHDCVMDMCTNVEFVCICVCVCESGVRVHEQGSV